MLTSILTLFLAFGPPTQDAKQLIDNNRVTVREVKSTAPIGQATHDVVAVDLGNKTAFFVAKGAKHDGPQHGIVIDLKDVSVPPLENRTRYPLAFPRPGVK